MSRSNPQVCPVGIKIVLIVIFGVDFDDSDKLGFVVDATFGPDFGGASGNSNPLAPMPRPRPIVDDGVGVVEDVRRRDSTLPLHLQPADEILLTSDLAKRLDGLLHCQAVSWIR